MSAALLAARCSRDEPGFGRVRWGRRRKSSGDRTSLSHVISSPKGFADMPDSTRLEVLSGQGERQRTTCGTHLEAIPADVQFVRWVLQPRSILISAKCEYELPRQTKILKLVAARYAARCRVWRCQTLPENRRNQPKRRWNTEASNRLSWTARGWPPSTARTSSTNTCAPTSAHACRN